jgi:hypothetical protein
MLTYFGLIVTQKRPFTKGSIARRDRDCAKPADALSWIGQTYRHLADDAKPPACRQKSYAAAEE